MRSKPRNLVGPILRKLRFQNELTQPDLAARCQVLGWNVSRDMIAAIEGQARCVTDYELVGLAAALRVPVNQLCPDKASTFRLLRS
jgi:transcriptional regulator with XRE-family HTH domain